MVTSITPDHLVALGGDYPLDGRVSWAPEVPGARQPTNTYLLLGEGTPLLVDPGLPSIAGDVTAGLAEFLEPGSAVEVYLSRAQFDCMGNLGAVAARWEVSRIYTGGQLNPFDAFEVAPLADSRSDGSNVVRSPDVSRLEIIHTPLRLLNTFWAYDEATATIFTSDSFTHCVSRAEDESPVLVDGDEDRTTAAEVRDHLIATFPWLDPAVTWPIVANLEALFAERPVARIAPGRGKVIDGEATVERHVEMVLDALRGCEAEAAG